MLALLFYITSPLFPTLTLKKVKTSKKKKKPNSDMGLI